MEFLFFVRYVSSTFTFINESVKNNVIDGESRPLLRYGRRDKIVKGFQPINLT